MLQSDTCHSDNTTQHQTGGLCLAGPFILVCDIFMWPTWTCHATPAVAHASLLAHGRIRLMLLYHAGAPSSTLQSLEISIDASCAQNLSSTAACLQATTTKQLFCKTLAHDYE
jgi:hypothetical protein